MTENKWLGVDAIGHCLLHVLCVYPPQPDGFDPDDWKDD